LLPLLLLLLLMMMMTVHIGLSKGWNCRGVFTLAKVLVVLRFTKGTCACSWICW
jgi:hypothetical protein